MKLLLDGKIHYQNREITPGLNNVQMSTLKSDMHFNIIFLSRKMVELMQFIILGELDD